MLTKRPTTVPDVGLAGNQELWDALLALGPGQRIRVYTEPDANTRWKNAVWVFRDTVDYPDDWTRKTVKVEYFADGRWHECEEGVAFDRIKPWRTYAG